MFWSAVPAQSLKGDRLVDERASGLGMVDELRSTHAQTVITGTV